MEVWISAHRFATLVKLSSVNLGLALECSNAGMATQPRFVEKSGFPVKSTFCAFQQMNGKDVCVASASLLSF